MSFSGLVHSVEDSSFLTFTRFHLLKLSVHLLIYSMGKKGATQHRNWLYHRRGIHTEVFTGAYLPWLLLIRHHISTLNKIPSFYTRVRPFQLTMCEQVMDLVIFTSLALQLENELTKGIELLSSATEIVKPSKVIYFLFTSNIKC